MIRHPHQSVGVPKRQRSNQNRVQHAKNSAARPNPSPHDQNRKDREAVVLPHRTKRKPQVPTKILQEHNLASSNLWRHGSSRRLSRDVDDGKSKRFRQQGKSKRNKGVSRCHVRSSSNGSPLNGVSCA